MGFFEKSHNINHLYHYSKLILHNIHRLNLGSMSRTFKKVASNKGILRDPT